MKTSNRLSRNHQRSRCALLVLSLSCLLSSPSALAQENKNLATADGNWSDPNAWSPSGVPLAADSIVNTSDNSRIIRLDSTETDAVKQANPFLIANITNNSTSTMSVRTLTLTGAQWLNVTGNVVQDSTGTLEFMNLNQLNVTVDGNVDVLRGTLSLGAGTTPVNNFIVTGLTTVKSGALLDIRFGSRPFFNGGVELEAGSNMRHVNPNAAASFPRDTFGGLRGSGTFTVQNTDTTNRVNLMRFFQNSGTWDYAGNIVMDQQSSGTLTTQLTRDGTDGAQILRGSIDNHTGATTVTGGVLAFAGDATLTSGNIQLNNTTAGVGSILGLGTGDLSRSLGSGNGTIRLSGTTAGFAAYDADRSVTLGAGALTWGGTNFSMDTLALGHASATHRIELTNDIALGAVTRTVQVGNGAAAVDARLSGILSGDGGLTVTGGGVLELTGNNSYAGLTSVNAGGLILGGAHSGAGGITVADGAWLGGNGSLAGSLTLNQGARLVFDPATSLTLDEANNVTLHNTFGVASLVNADGSAIDWTQIADGNYFLLTGTTTDFSGIQNFGIANAESIGGGRQAYFENGSLQLVVIPEPGTLMLMGLGAGALLLSKMIKR